MTLFFRAKCYRRFDEPKSFSDANSYCNYGLGIELGTLDSSLIEIDNRNELNLALRICRDPR